jgi:hypothetical protein
MRSDGAPVRPGARTPRVMSEAFEACKAEWDQARGHHQGQRSRERPHQQAGHKTAPDQLSEHQIVACNAGAIHTRHQFLEGDTIVAIWGPFAPQSEHFSFVWSLRRSLCSDALRIA